MAGIVTEARITCPDCGFSAVETMPLAVCLHYYQCRGCGQLLSPLPGECCVFCSYADSICPPKQMTA